MSSKGQSKFLRHVTIPRFQHRLFDVHFSAPWKMLRGIREDELAQVSNSRKRAVTDKSYVQSPFEVLSSLYDRLQPVKLTYGWLRQASTCPAQA